MKPFAFLVTCLLVATLTYTWWTASVFTIGQMVMFATVAAMDALLWALSCLDVPQ